MDKKFHYLYKVTHIKTGKIYIGIHSTDNVDDRYFACGVYKAAEKSSQWWSKANHAFENPNHIVNALLKHGPEAFQREILEFRPSRKKILELEEEIVNEDFVKSQQTFNHRSGGKGSFFAAETRELISKNNAMYRPSVRKKVGEAHKARWTEKMKNELSKNNPMYHSKNIEKLSGENSVWYGRTHSDKTKEKISRSRKNQFNKEQFKKARKKAAKTMLSTSKTLTKIQDLKTGKMLNSLSQVQEVLLKEHNLQRALSTISIHLKEGSKINSIINQRFKYKKRRTTSAPELRLRRRGQSYGFHVWIPYEKRYYKRSLATTDKNEALKKLADIERDFWQEKDRKKKLKEFHATPIKGGGGKKKKQFWLDNFEISDGETKRKFNSFQTLLAFLKSSEGIELKESYLRELVNGRRRASDKPKKGSIKEKLSGRFYVSKSPRKTSNFLDPTSKK